MLEKYLKRDKSIYVDKSLKIYGDNYKYMAYEEISELQKAITKAKRGSIDKDNLCEEVSHVIISLIRYMNFKEVCYNNKLVVVHDGNIDYILYTLCELQKSIILNLDVSDIFIAEVDVTLEAIVYIYELDVHSIDEWFESTVLKIEKVGVLNEK